MKFKTSWVILLTIALFCAACSKQEKQANIVATTMPVFTFTQALCDGTTLSTDLLVQENISCLHDYTLTVRHMKMLEQADLVIISGGGLEDFLTDALPESKEIIDASDDIHLHNHEINHDHGHHHDSDPHFWLSIAHARQMARTICSGLKAEYPQFADQFESNLAILEKSFDDLQNYAHTNLHDLQCRKLITFHDGFFYMAEELDLTILHSVEEESGSEASARDLIAICNLVRQHSIPAVFVENNGSDSAAKVISRETGAKLFTLDMAISGKNYFDAMYYNIDTLKEALG